MSAEVVWAGAGGHCGQQAVWVCGLCGVSKAYTWFSVDQAREWAEEGAAGHVCIQGGTQYWRDGERYYRTVCGDDGEVLLHHVYRDGWQPLDQCVELPIELCNAYYAPSQGGACDRPKGHEGNHHV